MSPPHLSKTKVGCDRRRVWRQIANLFLWRGALKCNRDIFVVHETAHHQLEHIHLSSHRHEWQEHLFKNQRFSHSVSRIWGTNGTSYWPDSQIVFWTIGGEYDHSRKNKTYQPSFIYSFCIRTLFQSARDTQPLFSLSKGLQCSARTVRLSDCWGWGRVCGVQNEQPVVTRSWSQSTPPLWLSCRSYIAPPDRPPVSSSSFRSLDLRISKNCRKSDVKGHANVRQHPAVVLRRSSMATFSIVLSPSRFWVALLGK